MHPRRKREGPLGPEEQGGPGDPPAAPAWTPRPDSAAPLTWGGGSSTPRQPAGLRKGAAPWVTPCFPGSVVPLWPWSCAQPSAEADRGPDSTEADGGPAREEADSSRQAPAVRQARPEMIFYFWLWISAFL